MDNFYYSFPAIRGIQAGKEYYVLICPLKVLPKIFLFDDEELLPEFRAQRTLNKGRIPEISSYILDNPESYIFSALTASVDAEPEFAPSSDEQYNIGTLSVPMTAKFIINDGQHRRAAIEEALKTKPDLGDETIPIVLFIDYGLKNSQQMFTDLNRYAIRPTKSLNIFYDNRDPMALLVKELIHEVKEFDGLVETEKSTISNRSKKLFTLSGVYHATSELLAGNASDSTEDKKNVAIDFWSNLWSHIIEWQMVRNNEITAASLRRDYINAHSIALIALGKVGYYLIKNDPLGWHEKFHSLSSINWHRNNSEAWEGRVTTGGKISNSRNNLILLVNYLKYALDLPLTNEEKNAEHIYNKEVGVPDGESKIN